MVMLQNSKNALLFGVCAFVPGEIALVSVF